MENCVLSPDTPGTARYWLATWECSAKCRSLLSDPASLSRLKCMNVRELETAVDPVAVFREWLREAGGSEPNAPNAAPLATATESGAPSVRIVLVKQVDERGFCFYTNAGSRKGREL